MLTNPPPRHPETDRTRRRKRSSERPRGQLVASGLELVQGGNRVLTGASLRAEPSTSTHIIGPSTSDTAALLGLLVGLYPPDAGTILLDGTNLTDLPLTTTRMSVALVLQEPWIMSGSIAENIAFGDPGVDRERIETMAKLACVDEFADRLPEGLDTAVGDAGTHLTIGQRRRVALARALLRNPVVLLVEDPLRDLTAREETHALRAIKRAGAGRTTIITSPRFNPAVFSADQILRLDGGTLHRVDIDDEVQAFTSGRASTAAASGTAPPMPPRPPMPPMPAHLATGAGNGAATGRGWAIDVGAEIVPGFRAAGLLERRDHTETWLAWQAEESRAVEIRVPRRSPACESARAELADEYERARRLQHPGLYRLLDANIEATPPFTVYERIEGPRLSEAIEARIDPPEVQDLLHLGADLARTLAYLHRLGHAHLDLRPEVVRWCQAGMIVTDLRGALPLGAELPPLCRSQHSWTTAPEQAPGKRASAAMDAYALGAVLYQAATGELLAGDSRPETDKVVGLVPDELSDLVYRLLADDPATRPTSAQALGVLRPLLLPVSPRPGGSRDTTGGGIDRDPAARVGAATDPVRV